jgi:hypothetical protein
MHSKNVAYAVEDALPVGLSDQAQTTVGKCIVKTLDGYRRVKLRCSRLS